MFFGASRPLGAKNIWKTRAPPRVRLFYWLVLHRRCWTGDRRFRHGLQQSSDCIFCDQLPETMDHIILGCVYSREVWSHILARLHLQDTIQVAEEDFMIWWLRSRKLLAHELRKGFDTLSFLIGWRLWKERNARTFDGTATTPLILVSSIWEEANTWALAGYRSLISLLGNV